VILVAAWQIQVANLRSDHAVAISAEEKKTRDVQSAFDGYKLLVEQQTGDNAAQRARELSAALDRVSELQDENDRLRADNIAKAKESRELANELLRRLNDAQPDQDSLLDARTRAYYGELRRRQTGADGARDQASAGSPH